MQDLMTKMLEYAATTASPRAASEVFERMSLIFKNVAGYEVTRNDNKVEFLPGTDISVACLCLYYIHIMTKEPVTANFNGIKISFGE